jgi:hypothetical protein
VQPDLQPDKVENMDTYNNKPKRQGLALNPDKLLGLLEPFAEGDFEQLMNYEWQSPERFYQSACDYVSSPADREVLKRTLKEAFPEKW